MKYSFMVDALVLSALPTFRAVAATGGFTAASGRLGVSPSAVSQTIRHLENRLGVRLFERTSRSVGLTGAGRQLLDQIDGPMAQLDTAVDEIGQSREQPSGPLRITTSRLAADICILPHLAGFIRRYPDIKLEISTNDRLTDIVRAGFDAGIRLHDALELDMISAPIGPETRRSILGSPAYFDRRGVPERPEDLSAHDVIRYRFPGSERLEPLRFSEGDQILDLDPPPQMILDDNAHISLATREGLGIAQRFLATEKAHLASGALVRVLEAFEPPPVRFHVYYPSREHQPARLRAFIDWFRG